MNVHSKNGSRGARSRTPKLPLCYYLSATSRTPWNVCEELRPQNLLKNERDGFRSPGRSSQTIAYICDLLGQARKRSRAFAISWEKLANDRVHLRSPGKSSQTVACICDLRKMHGRNGDGGQGVFQHTYPRGVPPFHRSNATGTQLER